MHATETEAARRLKVEAPNQASHRNYLSKLKNGCTSRGINFQEWPHLVREIPTKNGSHMRGKLLLRTAALRAGKGKYLPKTTALHAGNTYQKRLLFTQEIPTKNDCSSRRKYLQKTATLRAENSYTNGCTLRGIKPRASGQATLKWGSQQPQGFFYVCFQIYWG